MAIPDSAAPSAAAKDIAPQNFHRQDLGDLRFYERKYPDFEELVMVKVQRIAEMGAYVSLLEYNNIEGLILMNELSKRRFRSVNKLVKVGRHEVVLVLRVDPIKGYIDLSKRRVSPEDIVKCEERYSKSRKVHQTVRHVAQKHNIKVDYLNSRVIWPLYQKYGHALDALREAAIDAESVFAGLEVEDDVKQSLIQDIQLRLSPQPLKIRARVDVWCFGKAGIGAVKEALLAARDPEKDQNEIQVKLIAPPQYVVVTSCFDKEEGISKIQAAMVRISDKIKSFKGGDFKQQGDIVVMGSEEDKRLEELLQEETSESEDDEEEEDEGMGVVKEGEFPPDACEDQDEEEQDD